MNDEEVEAIASALLADVWSVGGGANCSAASDAYGTLLMLSASKDRCNASLCGKYLALGTNASLLQRNTALPTKHLSPLPQV
jgi:hypothetical protein